MTLDLIFDLRSINWPCDLDAQRSTAFFYPTAFVFLHQSCDHALIWFTSLLSSGQEEPSRCKIRQNWDFFRYVLFGTSQSISEQYFDLIATKNVFKWCLNFLTFIHSHINFKIFLTISQFNCWSSCTVLPDHWRAAVLVLIDAANR